MGSNGAEHGKKAVDILATTLPPHRIGLTAFDAAWHTGEGGQQRLTRPVCSPTSRGGGKTARVNTGRSGLAMLGRRPAGETARRHRCGPTFRLYSGTCCGNRHAPLPTATARGVPARCKPEVPGSPDHLITTGFRNGQRQVTLSSLALDERVNTKACLARGPRCVATDAAVLTACGVRARSKNVA